MDKKPAIPANSRSDFRIATVHYFEMTVALLALAVFSGIFVLPYFEKDASVLAVQTLSLLAAYVALSALKNDPIVLFEKSAATAGDYAFLFATNVALVSYLWGFLTENGFSEVAFLVIIVAMSIWNASAYFLFLSKSRKTASVRKNG